jgi:hypothetical protein
MNVVGVDAYFQQSILGLVIIASVALTFDRTKTMMIKQWDSVRTARKWDGFGAIFSLFNALNLHRTPFGAGSCLRQTRPLLARRR